MLQCSHRWTLSRLVLLQYDEGLDLVVSLVFTICLLENGCKVVVSMLNLAHDMSSNNFIASDVNFLSRDNGGHSCLLFLMPIIKQTIHLLSIIFSIMILYFVIENFVIVLLIL